MRKGFTLIEILIVLGVIVIPIATILSYNYEYHAYQRMTGNYNITFMDYVFMRDKIRVNTIK